MWPRGESETRWLEFPAGWVGVGPGAVVGLPARGDLVCEEEDDLDDFDDEDFDDDFDDDFEEEYEDEFDDDLAGLELDADEEEPEAEEVVAEGLGDEDAEEFPVEDEEFPVDDEDLDADDFDE